MALLAQRLDFIKNFPQLTVFQNLLFNLNVVKETKSKNIALGCLTYQMKLESQLLMMSAKKVTKVMGDQEL
jgi:hypothetical protein